MATALNPDQLSAITHSSGPLLIIAGAGTGKTTVITQRIKHLIDTKLAKPEEILALTFTDKAATEMETRLDELLPLGYTQLWITTFHSFCDRILRADGLDIGLDTDYQLLSNVSAVRLFQKHLFDFSLDYYRPLGNPTKFITEILSHFSRLADEDVSPKHYQEYVLSVPLVQSNYQELAQAYATHTQLKVDASALDFSDLIAYTLRLLRTRPNIQAKYQAQFKYILVDEYQDTNFAQNQLLKLLLAKSRNITVVADDDQAIYRFRGAAVGNVLKFQKDFKPKLVVLTHNYRSRQYILDAAYKFISHNNPHRLEIAANISKKLISTRPETSGHIQILHAPTALDEAELVVSRIHELLTTSHELQYRDIAILVRANAHAEPFIQALRRAGLPYRFLGPTALFAQPEIKDLLAFLQVLHDPLNDASLFRFLSSPLFGQPTLPLLKSLSQSQRNTIPLLDLLPDSDLLTAIHQAQAQIVSLPASQVLYNFLSTTGVLKKMLEPDSTVTATQAQNIAQFLTRLKTYESENPDITLADILTWVDLATKLGESPRVAPADLAEDAISLLTVHSSKGLEFPVVFLVNLVAERFPSRNRSEGLPIPTELVSEYLPELDFHLQEERRLFYVGLTRAKDNLYLSYADFYGDAKRLKKPSPFLAETLGEGSHPDPATTGEGSRHITPVIMSKSTTSHEPHATSYLTYSHIDTFLTCPLHYKAKYILGLPTPPAAALSFGSSIHATLKSYSAATSQDILKLLHKNWLTVGYTSPKHLAQAKILAEKYLTDFVKTYPSISPHLIESSFKFPISSDLTIGGRFDRIDKSKNAIHIIDYKTGKPKTQKAADKDLQLSLYILAATKVLKIQPEHITASFYYFQTQSFVTTSRTQIQLDQATEEVLAIRDQIQSSDFTCSGSIFCHNCEYKILCDIK